MLRPHPLIRSLLLAALLAGCTNARSAIVSSETVNSVSSEADNRQNTALSSNGAATNPAAPTAGADVEQLRQEILRLRSQLAAFQSAPGAAVGGAEDAASNARITTLQSDLQQEHSRRLAAEQELSRLKAETGAPLTVGRQVPESELYAVKQELVDLRRTLQTEREARERLSSGVAAIQDNPPAIAAASDVEWEARVQTLRQEKDKIIGELNQSLAASDARSKELAGKLDPATAAAAADTATVHAENSELRQRLADERHHTEDLEAKLQVANRLADLIFRMEQQKKITKPVKAKPKPTQAPEPEPSVP